jgi:predicted ATPase
MRVRASSAGPVDQVAELLDNYQLVTITGPGGVGKTRLADEVLKRVAGRFADGVAIVELAAVSEPALVAAMAATALHVRQAAGMSIVDALAARLSRQQLILVLDNCEHVLDAAAELCAALLTVADDIRILATSREPLGLPEEARFRLPPLTLPDRDTPDRSAEAVLLTADEQRVFRHVSVFPGPFTLDAAEAVAGPEAGLAVLRLVDCSLLVPPATGPDGRSRYLMLETLRGYGLTRLREAGEEREAAAALAGHALHVAEQAATQMAVRSGERSAALWLDAEEAAVHQGLAWALDHDPPAALRLAVALAQWWLVCGRWVQGYGLLGRAADQTGPDAGLWYTAHVWLGFLAAGTFDNDRAISHYAVVVDALSDGPPRVGLVDALVGRSAVLRNSAGLTEAPADAHAALQLARQLGYATGEAMALMEHSIISSYTENGERAIEWARQAQRIDRDLMPGWCARKTASVLPYVMTMSGHLDGVLDLCTEVLAQARVAGDLIDQADILYLMAVLARPAGRSRAAPARGGRPRHACRLPDAVDRHPG